VALAESQSYLECVGQFVQGRGAAGVIAMGSNRKRKGSEPDRDKLARRDLEEELDDALSNTFPASDPVSIVQPAPREPDRE
jgi:hypothetical protein